MDGHMGNRQVTQKKALVIAVDVERNLVFLRGAVPGGVNGLVLVRKRDVN